MPFAAHQCGRALKRLGVTIEAASDTAASAKMLSEHPDATRAAIAPGLASKIYGLDILMRDIEDEAHNTTRFIVMSADRDTPRPPVGARCVTSFLFRVRNLPFGALQGHGRLRDQRRQHDQAGKLHGERRLHRDAVGRPAGGFAELRSATEIVGVFEAAAFRGRLPRAGCNSDLAARSAGREIRGTGASSATTHRDRRRVGVFEDVRHGLTVPRIAAPQALSVDAVKYHGKNALQKLGLPDRRALRMWDGVARGSALHGKERPMAGDTKLGAIHQLARTVSDIAVAQTWYAEVLGLPLLYAFPGMAFFDCGGVRLYLQEAKDGANLESILYFKVADVRVAAEDLTARGVIFTTAPHMVHRHPDGSMAGGVRIDGLSRSWRVKP